MIMTTNSTTTSYRLMIPGEEEKVSKLVRRVFMKFISPEYSAEGVDEYLRYISPEALAQRSKTGHFVIVAEEESNSLIGMLEIGNCDQISLLFVSASYQQRGVAKDLMNAGVEKCRSLHPGMTQLSVNASPNAVEIYEHLGFKVVEEEKIVNGIRFTPMVLYLT